MIDNVLRSNRHILLTMLALIIIGTLFIINITDIQFRENSYSFIAKRLFTIFIGLIVLMFAFSFDIKEYIQKYATLGLFFSFILLAVIHIPGIGITINGSTRWISILGWQFQPSEFAKIAVIFGVSNWLSKIPDKTLELRHLKKELFVIVTFFWLVALEPDLGNAIIISLSALMLIYIAGFNIRILILFGLILAILVSIFIYSHSWRMNRVRVVLNPEIDKYNSGYQPYKSIQGISTGGITGKGFGNSFNKCFFLRESHTDYIFSIYAEETGLIGSIGLIILYIILVFEGFHIAYSADSMNYFKKYAAFGIVFLISFQVCLNLAVATSLVPSKGLPLPLFSFGGSSLIATMFMIGFLLRVDYENNKSKY